MPRFALRIVQLGAIGVVLLALPYTVFDLDRFLVPKELALHLTVVIAGLAALGAVRRTPISRVDLLLGAYLLLGVASAVLATNRWLGLRALAVSASGIALFWIARALRDQGLQRPLLVAIAIAAVLAALTSLLQAYGVRLDIFALNRAPGGTLGNRNFVAHVAAIGLPVCILLAMSNAVALGGIAILSAALVLTRSRAAWLACAAMLLVFIVAVVVAREWPALRRFIIILIFAAAGVAAALLIPNTLRWNSDNPYLQSVQGVANYQEGSGRGRLVQYGNSLGVAIRHPLFGVGPGNWAVAYPAHASRNDPSLNPSQPGMTYNPWPSSDWIAWIAERGLAATILLALALIGIARAPAEPEQPKVARAALLATLTAAVVAGLFDAVLLLAVPSFLVWAAAGALSPRREDKPLGAPIYAAVLVLSLLGAAYSGAQLVAMQMFVTGGRGTLEQASRIDPGNYRLQVRLAEGGRRRCEHATAAHELFPNAAAAARLARGCR